MPTSSRSTTGLAIFALLAVVDISWAVLSWAGALGSDIPPTGALISFVVVGAVTLATLRPAQHGSRPAVWIMLASRVVAVFLIDLTPLLLGAPAWIKIVASIAILLTVLGIWCTAPLLRRTRAGDAAARVAS